MSKSLGWKALFTAAVLSAAPIGLLACSDSGTDPTDGGPPNHTVLKGGVAHAPGLTTPAQSCATCHGADLMGGTAGQPSCYSCHGRKW
jgi:cytochrome c5